MQLDPEEMETIGWGIAQAHEAFNFEIGKDGTDPAHYRIRITVTRLDTSFENTLATITYEDNG